MGMVDIMLATVVANSLKIADPVWITLIGASSGGKSQIIRPFAIANSDFIYQLDDLTPNTLLSGQLGYKHSLLGRIGPHGMLSMDDLTVLFSKNSEARGEILSQFRMLYDGRFSKSSGNRKEEIVWPEEGRGHLGMIAGSTPSIYRYFNEVADMGERFISYRMKDIDVEKATDFVMQHNLSSSEMNELVADAYTEYMQTVLPQVKQYELPQSVKDKIRVVSPLVTLMRTPVSIDEFNGGYVDEFPIPEMPFRVMKQLTTIAKALYSMHKVENPEAESLPDDLLNALTWCAYSLSNDKRRKFMSVITRLYDDDIAIDTNALSIGTGLHPDVIGKGVNQLEALKIIEKKSETTWRLQNLKLASLVREVDPYPESILSRGTVHDSF